MKTFISFVLTVLLALMAITFISCKKEDIESNKQVLIPLKTGNKWTYESHQNSKSSSAVLEVGAFVIIDGYEGYKFLSGTRPYNSTFIVANDDNGNFVSVGGYSEVDTLFSPSINYKLNAITGESWDYEDVYVNYDSGIFEKKLIKIYCIKTDTTITTPKGRFKCIVFEYSPNDGDDVFRSFVSLNIGIVKSEHYEYNNLFSYMTLSDYILK
jgi:hypothetical protein